MAKEAGGTSRRGPFYFVGAVSLLALLALVMMLSADSAGLANGDPDGEFLMVVGFVVYAALLLAAYGVLILLGETIGRWVAGRRARSNREPSR